MNKAFRSIWNAAKQAYVAAAETVATRGKPSSSGHTTAALGTLMGGLLSWGAYAQTAPPPGALPTGGQVSAGQVRISQSGASMLIDQASNRAAIDWQSFNVGASAHVQFNQPSAASVTLNRVLSNDPSQIFGRITANGQIILTNPQGVYFSRDARVDVGGLVATTHGIGNADFMAGNSRFERSGSSGKVINDGELKAALGGYIALLAPEVRNQGAIIARMGTVVLAAGEAMVLHFDSNNRLTSLRVEPSTVQALVDNRHAVQAPGGLIILSAQSLDRLAGGVVKNSGRLEANGLQQQGGRIILSATRQVDNTGTVAANATAGNSPAESGPAGKIEITAPDVINSGLISATGWAQAAAGAIAVQATEFTQTVTGAMDLSAPVQGGTLSLQARGSVMLEGQVNASAAPAEASQGGRIEIAAEGDITLNNATLDASGGHGGQLALRAAAEALPDNPTPLPDSPGRGHLAVLGQSTLSTRGRRGAGGRSTLLGDHIDLLDESRIDASGSTGGGTVLVGGDWQGGNGVFQAKRVTMSTGTFIDASATQLGNGGTVVLWSDIRLNDSLTAVHGTVRARGGAVTGDGGQIETSGSQVDIAGFQVDTWVQASSGGKAGLWLIDPYDYNINQTAATAIGNALRTADVIITTDTANNITSYGSNGNASSPGKITLNANVSITKGAGAVTTTLSLRAWNDIQISTGSTIQSSGAPLNLVFISDFDANGGGGVFLDGFQSRINLKTGGGHVWIGGNGYGTGLATANDPWVAGIQVGTGFANSADSGTMAEGVNIKGATIDTGGGNLYIAGRNGRYVDNVSRFGVLIQNEGGITSEISTGSGSITIKGDLAPRSVGFAPAIRGVHIVNSTLQSVTGAISITGGEGAAQINHNSTGYGVSLLNSRVFSGSGSITLTGTIGPDGGQSTRDALRLEASGANTFTEVSTTTGTITLTGNSWVVDRGDSAGVRFVTSQTNNVDTNNPAVYVVSNSGQISITGDNANNIATGSRGILFQGTNFGKFYVGQGSETYTGNITLSGRSLGVENTAAGYVFLQGTGALTLQPTTNAANGFVRGASTADTFMLDGYWNIGTEHSSLTLGRELSSGTDTLAVSAGVSAKGPINLYAGTINLNANLTATGSSAAILAKTPGNIVTNSSRTWRTDGGGITFWSDSDSDGSGYILVGNNAFFDSRSAADRTASQIGLATAGGTITLAGGAGAAGLPIGYASSSAATANSATGEGGVGLGNRNTQSTEAASGNLTKMYSGGGNIVISGKSSGQMQGMHLVSGGDLNAGSGQITIQGVNVNASSGINHGIELGSWRVGTTTVYLAAGAGVSVVGSAPAADGNGVQISAAELQAFGSGGVTVQGTASKSGNYDIIGSFNALASSGAINITGGAQQTSLSGIFGGKANTAVGANSTSSITVTGNTLNFGAGSSVDSTGTLTLTPAANGSFASAYTWGSSLSVPEKLGGLVLGGTGNTNTADITINSAVTIAGPITVQGGNINLNASLTTKASGAAVTLQARGDIAQTGGVGITTNAGHVIYWADTDGNNLGRISLALGSGGSPTSVTTNGGNIVMGGGINAGAVPTGFAWSAQPNGAAAVSLAGLVVLNAGSTGDITLRGRNAGTGSNNVAGLLIDQTSTLTGRNVTLEGVGSASTGSFSGNFGTLIQFSTVNVNGTLTITGTGGGGSSTGSQNSGVLLNGSSLLRTGSGSGAFTITGTGGGRTTSVTNLGIELSDGVIVSGGGTLTMTATAGPGTSAVALGMRSTTAGGGSALGAAGQTGAITVRANAVSFQVAGASNSVAGTGTLTFEPTSASFNSLSTLNLSFGADLTGVTIGSTSNTSDVKVESVGGINIAGPITIFGGAVTLNQALATSSSSTGNVSINAATLTGNAGINLANGKSLTVSQSGSSIYGGAISGASASVTKLGTGTLILSGLSNYTGVTTVSEGVLKLGATGSGGNSPLGTTGGGTVVASGAALDLGGLTLATTEALTLSGTGVNAGGALFNSTANAAYNGAITLAANTSIRGGTGSLTLGGAIDGAFELSVTSPNTAFTQSGPVGGTTPLQKYTVDAGTGTVTISGATTVNGPITIGGGTLAINANVKAAASLSTLQLKSTGNITTGAGVSLQTNNSDLVLWADSDGISGGRIALGDSTTLNLANGSTSTVAGGGAIVLAGGTTSVNGLPTGYASGVWSVGVAVGTTAASAAAFYSGGGDVTLLGKSSPGSHAGVTINGGLTMDSGQGAIRIMGESAGFTGLNLSESLSTNAIRLTSAKVSGAAITLSGITTGASMYGLVVNWTTPKDIRATGGGDIELTGVGMSGGYGIRMENANVLASTGAIKLDGGVQGTYIRNGTTTLGKSSSGVTASSSAITITSDRLTIESALVLDTTGAVTVQPFSESFSGLLNWSLVSTNGSTLGGLTLGKLGNTSGIAMGATSVAGPINLWGGAVTLSGTLTTTTSGGDINITTTRLGGSGSMQLAIGRTLTVYQSVDNDSYSGAISGPQANLVKLGAGTLTLTGNNSYSGTTTLSEGALQIGLGGASGTLGTGAVSNSGTLIFNRSGTLIVGNAISGSGELVKQGTGTITLSGVSSFTGATTISTGIVKLGASSNGANSPLGTVDGATTVASGAGLDLGGFSLSTAESLTLSGTGVSSGGALFNSTATAASYSGAITLAANTTIKGGSAALTLGGGFDGAYSLTVSSTNAAFTQGGVVGGGTTLTGYSVSTGTGHIVISDATSAAGPITLAGNNVSVNGALVATGSNGIGITASGNVTSGANGYVKATTLLLTGGSVTLINGTDNAIGTLAASGVSNLSYRNQGALALATVGSTNGISASGVVDIGTLSGNLTLAQNVSTTNTSGSALTLHSGISASAGALTGGDIVISGVRAVSVGPGGTGKLLTGSLAGSTGLVSLSGLGSGSGRFRYNADETINFASGSWTPLGTGLHAVFREAPSATLSSNALSITYGTSLPAVTATGLINGDVSTYSITGASYTGAYLNASGTAYAITPSLLGLGYTLASASGTLSVSPKALTIAAPTVASKTYDATTAAGALSLGALSGFVGTETVTASGTAAALGSANVGTYSTSVAYALANGSNGGLASNYSLASSSAVTAGISPKALTIAAPTIASKTYDATTAAGALSLGALSGFVGSETVTASGTAAALGSANVGTYSTSVAYALANGSSGGLASNYSLASSSAVTAGITAKALTIAAPTLASKTYDATTAAGALSLGALSGFVGSETVTASGTAAALGSANVGTYSTSVAYALANGSSGGLASNYSLASSSAVTAGISAKALTIAAPTVASKTYDATTAAGALSLGALSGFVGSETVTASGTAAALGSANVGTYSTSVAYALANGSSGGLASNYSLASSSAVTAGITAKALTIAAPTLASKTYDATTAAGALSLGALSGFVGSETVIASGTAAALGSANVGTYSTSVAYALANGSNGGLASNYSLASSSAVTAGITPKALTISGLTAENKSYDGTNSVIITNWGSVSTGVGLETIALRPESAAFTSAGAGMDKTVIASGYRLADGAHGGLAGNYVLGSTSAGTTASIAKSALTITANNDAKFVLQNEAPGYAGASYSGFVNGETQAVLTGALTVARANPASGLAGVYANELQASGLRSSNYQITYLAGTYTIVPSDQLLVRVMPVSSTYGTLTQYSVSSVEYFNGAQAVRLDDGSVAGTGVTAGANNLITIKDGASASASFTLGPLAAGYSSAQFLKAGSYQLGMLGLVTANSVNFSDKVTVVGSHQVNTRALSASASGVSKVYDGSTAMKDAAVSLSGVLNNDLVSSQSVVTFDDPNARTNKGYNISNISLTNIDAGNYHLAGTGTFQGTDGAVTPKALGMTLPTIAAKVYDGTPGAGALLLGTMSGLVGQESLEIVGTAAALVSANAGSYSTSVSYSLANGGSGGLASNYSLMSSSGVPAVITPKSLALSGLSSADKVYDGTLNAAVSGTASFSSVAVGSGSSDDGKAFEGDTVNVTGAAVAAFNTKDTSTANTVSFSGLSLMGAQAGNYILAPHPSVTASITAKALTTTGLASANKVYDGTAGAAVSGMAVLASQAVGTGTSADGKAYSGDSVALSGTAVGTFNSQQVVSASTVSFSGLSLTGAQASNYTLTAHASASHSISAKALTIAAPTIASKTYDATTAAGTLSLGALSGFVGTETVTASGTAAALGSANVGTYSTSVAYALANGSNGGLASNYSLADSTNVTASITPKALTIAAPTVASKTYDATTAAGALSLGALSGFVGTETVTASGTAAALGSANVGTYSTSVAYALANGSNGGLASNYSLAVSTAVPADTIPKQVTLSGLVAEDKTYDGTTAVRMANWGAVRTGVRNETLALQWGQARFEAADAGMQQTVIASGYRLADGDHGGLASNYALSSDSASTTATISKAALTVRMNNDAKFVVQDDMSSYAGASYRGLVNGQTQAVLGGALTITRSNASTQAAGSYAGVLVGSGQVSNNYSISYEAGDFVIVPAGQLLVRVAQANTIYGSTPEYRLTSVAYFDEGRNAVVRLDDNSVAGARVSVSASNQVSIDDGAAGSARFTLVPVTPARSLTKSLPVGSYQLAAWDVSTENSNNFSNTLTVVGTQQVSAKPLQAAPNNLSKGYDGSSTLSAVGLSLQGVQAGDQVTGTGQVLFDNRNAGSGKAFSMSNLLLDTSPDSGNYYIDAAASPGLSGIGAVITPKTVTLEPQAVSRVYDGSTTYSATQADLAHLSRLLGIPADSVSAATLTFTDKNVGTGKTLMPSAVEIDDGNGGRNYAVRLSTNSSSAITRLSSVTWVGGASGNWFDPSKWAGGAVPDLSNVAQVVVAPGAVVSFDARSARAPSDASSGVQIDGLEGSGSSLNFQSGELAVGSGGVTLSGLAFSAGSLANAGNFTLLSYSQSGGNVAGAGKMSSAQFSQTGGNTSLSGDLSVAQRFSQGSVGTLAIGGDAVIHDTSGGALLGNLHANGVVTVISTAGAITQATGTGLSLSGGGSFTASGTDGLPAPIELNNAGNQLQGTINLAGSDLTVRTSDALTLGAVTAANNLLATSTGNLSLGSSSVQGDLTVASGGNITQGGPLLVRGRASFSADGSLDLPNRANRLPNVVLARAARTLITGDSKAAVQSAETAALAGKASMAAVSAELQSLLLAVRPVLSLSDNLMGPPGPTRLNAETPVLADLSVEDVVFETRDTSLSGTRLLLVAVPQAMAAGGTPLAFKLPPDVLEPASDGSPTSAGLPDGSPLPGWLAFDAAAMRFSAISVPSKALPIQLLLTAGDKRLLVLISVKQD